MLFQSVLTVTLNLLLFRAGPQDFPYDPRLTGWLVPIAVMVNYFVLSLALPPVLAAAIAFAVVMALSFSTRLFLRARNLDSRFMQTFHALLVVSSVMTLALMLPFSEVAPELQRIAATQPGPTDPMPQLDVPTWAALSMNALNIWNFAVNAHIFRQAGNSSLAGGLLVALLVALGMLMFVALFASFVGALFGNPA
jgi:hypothetical protein